MTNPTANGLQKRGAMPGSPQPHSPALGVPKGLSHEEIFQDYRLSFISRQVSILSRKEVLSGKAKFGIFGDGKEVAQVALARCLKKGDWRSGYYRDQTIMLALGEVTVKQLFAQVYADSDVTREPMSGGRQMNAHFATRLLNKEGQWVSQLAQHNTAADLSPTAAQMGRLVGLGYASKLYRQNPQLHEFTKFSNKGQEIAFGTIGNASAAEGLFWESLNACGVLQIPVAIMVWDDDYGISVPNRYQMTKESISDVVLGFAPNGEKPGIDIYKVCGWDYRALYETFKKGIALIRDQHSPALFHVVELTQPQGHSTSGSHERYKPKERLVYEAEYDCLKKMRQWVLSLNSISDQDLEQKEREWAEEVKNQRDQAWNDFQAPIVQEVAEFRQKIKEFTGFLAEKSQAGDLSSERQIRVHGFLEEAERDLRGVGGALRRQVAQAMRRLSVRLLEVEPLWSHDLRQMTVRYLESGQSRYRSHLTLETLKSPLNGVGIPAEFGDSPEMLAGHEIMQRFFDDALSRDPRIFIIGEDVGVLGDVNQNFKGLHEKFGELRITDTGIREATILGQGIGAALRGLRPVVDIQYLDYMLYCFQLLSDDLACLHYRSAGGQAAPVIVRTKGHRLEGIWHSGSPMGTLIHGVRGIHLAVPRNFVQAAGLYRTLMDGDDPAIVIEVLNSYRLKEVVPTNLGTFRVPLGMPEILRKGNDLTLVTYGACVRVALDASEWLQSLGIEVEVVDVQTLLPFDLFGVIRRSLEKTHAVLFMDEDVPGGATAYMLQQVLEAQKSFDLLEIPPRTLTAPANRPAYGSDGDYFCKPTQEDLIELIYDMMRERTHYRFPAR